MTEIQAQAMHSENTQDAPIIQIFDLEGLISTINRSMDNPEQDLSLGEFEHKEPKKNPFLYRVRGRVMQTRGKFPLYQSRVNKWSDVDFERRIGYFLFESGLLDEYSSFSGTYETLMLRIKRPVQLKSGIVIPKSSVKIYYELEEGIDTEPVRKDHVYHGLISIGSDMEHLLPTAWFLKRSIAEQYAQVQVQKRDLTERSPRYG